MWCHQIVCGDLRLCVVSSDCVWCHQIVCGVIWCQGTRVSRQVSCDVIVDSVQTELASSLTHSLTQLTQLMTLGHAAEYQSKQCAGEQTGNGPGKQTSDSPCRETGSSAGVQTSEIAGEVGEQISGKGREIDSGASGEGRSKQTVLDSLQLNAQCTNINVYLLCDNRGGCSIALTALLSLHYMV